MATRERERASSGDSSVSGARGGSGDDFERAWRDELRALAARALNDLARRDGSRAELVSEGALFKLMELAAEADTTGTEGDASAAMLQMLTGRLGVKGCVPPCKPSPATDEAWL